MSVIKKSDQRVKKIKSAEVYISAAAKNSNAIPPNRAVNLATIAAAAYDVLRKCELLVLPSDVIIRIANTKKATNNGAYYPLHKVVVVDPRNSYESMMETICHEFVHAEQYYEGRLKWDGRKQYWNDEVVTNKGTTYNRYRALPWEIEAFSRQKTLALQVWKALLEMGVIGEEWVRNNLSDEIARNNKLPWNTTLVV